jgi:hypothetical protein
MVSEQLRIRLVWKLLMDVNIRRKPWSAPRLRGRGEQGSIVIRSQSPSALYVPRPLPIHAIERSQIIHQTQSSALLTTASLPVAP